MLIIFISAFIHAFLGIAYADSVDYKNAHCQPAEGATITQNLSDNTYVIEFSTSSFVGADCIRKSGIPGGCIAIAVLKTNHPFTSAGIISQEIHVIENGKIAVKKNDGFTKSYVLYEESDKCKLLLKLVNKEREKKSDLQERKYFGSLNPKSEEALVFAITKGTLQDVKKCVEAGAIVETGSQNNSPLMRALERQDLNIITYLIEKGAKAEDKFLKRAIYDQNFELVEILISNGKRDLTYLGPDNNTGEIHDAIWAATLADIDFQKKLISLAKKDGVKMDYWAALNHAADNLDNQSNSSYYSENWKSKLLNTITFLLGLVPKSQNEKIEISSTKVKSFLTKIKVHKDLSDSEKKAIFDQFEDKNGLKTTGLTRAKK